MSLTTLVLTKKLPGQEMKDMNTQCENGVVNLRKAMVVLVAVAVCFTMLPGFKGVAQAGKGAAFIGGALVGGVVKGAVDRSERSTKAEESQAYSAQQQRQAAAPAPAAKPSAESRIQQLDKLAAGGYITPEEYKTKKAAILSEM